MLVFIDESGDPGLKLGSGSTDYFIVSDMVCGAVARSYSGKDDAKAYRSLISHREIYVQFWPK